MRGRALLLLLIGTAALAACGPLPLEQAEAETGAAVEGDRELARRFTGLFSLPEKIA